MAGIDVMLFLLGFYWRLPHACGFLIPFVVIFGFDCLVFIVSNSLSVVPFLAFVAVSFFVPLMSLLVVLSLLFVVVSLLLVEVAFALQGVSSVVSVLSVAFGEAASALRGMSIYFQC